MTFASVTYGQPPKQADCRPLCFCFRVTFGVTSVTVKAESQMQPQKNNHLIVKREGKTFARKHVGNLGQTPLVPYPTPSPPPDNASLNSASIYVLSASKSRVLGQKGSCGQHNPARQPQLARNST
eukprot:1151159-Pelagomonas_calceolata.AAC.5